MQRNQKYMYSNENSCHPAVDAMNKFLDSFYWWANEFCEYDDVDAAKAYFTAMEYESDRIGTKLAKWIETKRKD